MTEILLGVADAVFRDDLVPSTALGFAERILSAGLVFVMLKTIRVDPSKDKDVTMFVYPVVAGLSALLAMVLFRQGQMIRAAVYVVMAAVVMYLWHRHNGGGGKMFKLKDILPSWAR